MNNIPQVTNSWKTKEGNRQALKEAPFRKVTRIHTEAIMQLVIMQYKSMAVMMLDIMINSERISSNKNQISKSVRMPSIIPMSKTLKTALCN